MARAPPPNVKPSTHDAGPRYDRYDDAEESNQKVPPVKKSKRLGRNLGPPGNQPTAKKTRQDQVVVLRRESTQRHTRGNTTRQTTVVAGK